MYFNKTSNWLSPFLHFNADQEKAQNSPTHADHVRFSTLIKNSFDWDCFWILFMSFQRQHQLQSCYMFFSAACACFCTIQICTSRLYFGSYYLPNIGLLLLFDSGRSIYRMDDAADLLWASPHPLIPKCELQILLLTLYRPLILALYSVCCLW